MFHAAQLFPWQSSMPCSYANEFRTYRKHMEKLQAQPASVPSEPPCQCIAETGTNERCAAAPTREWALRAVLCCAVQASGSAFSTVVFDTVSCAAAECACRCS